jgi:hypothetical protein
MQEVQKKSCELAFLQAKYIQNWIWKENKVPLLSTMLKYEITMSPLRQILPLSNTITNTRIILSQYP